MEKFNWKFHAKESFKTCINDLVYMAYMVLAMAFILYTQTQKQIEYIIGIITERDWVMIFIMIIGILVLSVIIEKLIKSVWSILKFIVRVIKSLSNRP